MSNKKINTENKNLTARLAAVAGKFYPAGEVELKEKIDSYLAKVASNKKDFLIKAIIVPHAGYEFSGSVAAAGFKSLSGKKPKTIVLLGSAHSAYFAGAAWDDSDYYETPLGRVSVDKEFGEKLLRKAGLISKNRSAHLSDHVLEVQIPFLQRILGNNFKIVPIILGDLQKNDYKILARALKEVLSKDDFLVASSDMSHYPSREDARLIDEKTLELIKEGCVEKLDIHINDTLKKKIKGEETLLCGQETIKTIMELSEIFGWQAEILKYSNSGDFPFGDREAVVGYGSIAFRENSREFSGEEKLSESDKKTLLKIARKAVGEFLRTGKIKDFDIPDERLNKKNGAFVTIRQGGELRGCIGLIVSDRAPLWQTVRDMAIAAATEDGRFMKVNNNELDDLDFEISVLSEPREIKDWREIELGRHGVIVSQWFHKGVFLPQVAPETGWAREEFLSHLCADKAGLAANCYLDPKTKIEVFEAEVFGEIE